MDILTQRLIVFRKKILAELRRISDSIKEHKNTTPKANEAHEKQNSPTPETLVVNIPQSVEVKKSESDAKQDDHHRKRLLLVQWILCIATIGTFCAALYYARTSQRQLDAMELARRPWIGIDDGVSIDYLNVDIFRDGTMATPKGMVGVNLNVSGVITIRNSGASPALEERWTLNAVPAEGKYTSDSPPPINCNTKRGVSGKSRILLPGATPTKFEASGFNGTGPIEADTGPGPTNFPENTVNDDVSEIWLIGCINYKTSAGDMIHHTKFWLLSTYPQNSPWVPNYNDHGRHMPFSGFETFREEAD